MPRPADQPAAYRETLLPSAAVWVVVLAVTASFGLVALKVAGGAGALGVAAIAMALAAAALLATSPRIAVGDGHLQAGRARIPVDLIGRVVVVDGERMAALRGREADARAYLCQRAWISQGVVAEVVDPADPTPYWLMSSRNPRRLAAALRAAAGSDDGSGQAHSRHTG